MERGKKKKKTKTEVELMPVKKRAKKERIEIKKVGE